MPTLPTLPKLPKPSTIPALAAVTLVWLTACTVPAPTEHAMDPFGYCQEVGTVDAPGPEWSDPAAAASVAEALQFQLGLPELPPDGSYSWRCMGGEVWGCFVGANLTCGPANVDTTPTEGMEGYCTENADSDFIPAYITGHDTVWEWRCDGTSPVTGRQLSEVDERGFQAGNWYRLDMPQ